MKALVYHGNQDLRYEEFAEPKLLPGEVRLKVRAAGMCHTDFNEYLNGPLYIADKPHPRTGRSVPIVQGHEFAGEVIDVASDVTSLRPGDRVAVNAVDACRRCEFCRKGLLIHCKNAAVIGFSRDGGFAEYAVVPEHCCHKLRPGVSYQAAALVEPLSVGLHAIKRAHVPLGSQVAIIGGGTIGLCTLQGLRASGASDVYVIEKSPGKRKYAEEMGASEFLLATEPNLVQAIRARTGGMGVDIAFECVGSGPALQTALAVTRPGGTVCLIGVVPRAIEFNWNDVLSQEKTITTTIAYDDEFPIAIAMLADGRLKSEPLITSRMRLEDARETLSHFEEIGRDNIKMLIEMGA